MAFRIGTYWKEEDVKTYDVNEGDISFDTGFDIVNNKRTKIAKFSKEVQDGTFLSLYIDSTNSKELMMGQASLDTTGYATHFNPYEPEVAGGFIPEKPVGETITFGNYTPRHVGCAELKAGKEYRFPLYAKNAQIKAGDYLIVRDDSRTIDKLNITEATKPEDQILQALEDVPANAGQEEIFCYTKEARVPVTKKV